MTNLPLDKVFRMVSAIAGSNQAAPSYTDSITWISLSGSISFRQYALAPAPSAAQTSASLLCEVKIITFILLSFFGHY